MAASSTPPGPIEVFFSYAHEDEPLLGELLKHLGILKRLGVIRDWHDRKITAGTEWKGQIDQPPRHRRGHPPAGQCRLRRLRLLLGCRAEAGHGAARPGGGPRHPGHPAAVDGWQAAPFGKLQAAPTDGRPVTGWPNRDEAFADVAGHIRRAVEELRNP